MKTQTITLKITVADDYQAPSEWNWGAMLDLGVNESCELVDFEPVKEEVTQ